jgi:hypothetical protein
LTQRARWGCCWFRAVEVTVSLSHARGRAFLLETSRKTVEIRRKSRRGEASGGGGGAGCPDPLVSSGWRMVWSDLVGILPLSLPTANERRCLFFY